jgi:hypothetical protein
VPALLIPLLVNCSGSVDGGGASGEPGGSAGGMASGTGGAAPMSVVPSDLAANGFTPPPPALRKLTAEQYANSVHDVLGATIAVPDDLERDTPVNGYVSIATAQATISPTAAEKLESAAYEIAAQAMTNLRTTLVPCVPSGPGDAVCAEQVLTQLLERAFRRTPTPAEISRHVTLATSAGTTLGDFHLGIEFGIAGILQAIPFLYRVELGEPDPVAPTLVRFTSTELASRLSYLVWNSTPDAELLAKAADGSLSSDAGLLEQMTRLLASPRAREGIRQFHVERLGLDELDDVVKDAELFPEMTDSLSVAMREEVERFVEDLVFDQPADYRLFLSGDSTFVNGELASLYDVPSPGPGFARTTWPQGSPRTGFLTSAAFLSMNAGADETIPSRRGKFVRETILCQSIPAPPPNVMAVLPEPNPNARTMRERLSEHATSPTCSGCHSLMDPIGLAFEHFDALGRFRELDNGAPIDVSGILDGTPFTDASDLSRVLSESPIAAACTARNLYRYTVGHVEGAGEAVAIDALVAAFVNGGYRFDQLVLALATNPGLRFAGIAPAGI